MPSWQQLLILLVIVALLFGTKRLKNIGGDVGGAIKGFKKAMSDDKSDNDAEASTNSKTDQLEKTKADTVDGLSTEQKSETKQEAK